MSARKAELRRRVGLHALVSVRMTWLEAADHALERTQAYIRVALTGTENGALRASLECEAESVAEARAAVTEALTQAMLIQDVKLGDFLGS